MGADAQRILGNIIIPPQEFKQPPSWYYRMREVIYYDFGAVTYGITSIPNFIKISTDIL
jgi:hypothetical protein